MGLDVRNRVYGALKPKEKRAALEIDCASFAELAIERGRGYF